MLTNTIQTIVSTTHIPDEHTVVTYELSRKGRFYQNGNDSKIRKENYNPKSYEIDTFPVIFNINPYAHPCSITITVERIQPSKANKRTAGGRSLNFSDNPIISSPPPPSSPSVIPKSPVRHWSS